MTNPSKEAEELLANITPGEWIAFIGMDTVEIQINGDEQDTVIHWSGFDSCNKPLQERQANARLIAAAPRLLRELVEENKRLEAKLDAAEKVITMVNRVYEGLDEYPIVSPAEHYYERQLRMLNYGAVQYLSQYRSANGE